MIRGRFLSSQDCLLVAHSQVSDLPPRTSSLPQGDITPWFLTSTCSPAPSPIPITQVCSFQQEEMPVVPSGRGPEGKLLPQEGISDGSAVFLWVFFLGGRRQLERQTGREGTREGQEPRLLGEQGRRRGRHTALLQAVRAAAAKQFLEIYSFLSLSSQPPPSPPPFFF